jgi:hypothetical protein
MKLFIYHQKRLKKSAQLDQIDYINYLRSADQLANVKPFKRYDLLSSIYCSLYISASWIDVTDNCLNQKCRDGCIAILLDAYQSHVLLPP